MRGVALRSSRSEPFGERFLRRALLCLLTNDVPGVQRAFLETVEAIRRWELPASEMGSRVRLSKSPEAYLASRASHPEPQYEALLAAGRTRWYPGERVRFYRTRNKAYVWLPDEAQESTFRGEWEEEIAEGGNDGLKSPSEDQGVKSAGDVANRRDYDVEHYLSVLVTSYAGRLRKAFAPQDFEQLFRLDAQVGLFDQPVEEIEPRWIRE